MNDYWKKQAAKHDRMAETMRAKYRATAELRWLRSANTNKAKADGIRAYLRDVAS